MRLRRSFATLLTTAALVSGGATLTACGSAAGTAEAGQTVEEDDGSAPAEDRQDDQQDDGQDDEDDRQDEQDDGQGDRQDDDGDDGQDG